MIEIVYSPKWFYGKDIAIDIIGIVILFLIAFFSLKYYRLSKNKNYLFLSASFFMISLSYFFKIITNFTIYYQVLQTKRFIFGTITYTAVESSDILFVVGFLLYRLLILLGFFFLYSIYEKPSKFAMIFIAYLLIVSTYFTNSAYFMFHITALILLSFISYTFYRNCRKNKQKTSMLLFFGFLVITVSHLMSTFVIINPWIYVAAEITQLAGYLMLLIMFIMVLRHAKKKK